MRWYNTVLRYDDPWWKTHYPPNGWGCKCGVTSHSASELDRLRADGVPLKEEAPQDGDYTWINPASGQPLQIPKGIDPGWAYNPGAAAWGERLSEEAMAAWQAKGITPWERLTPGSAAAYGRPSMIPSDTPRAQFGRPTTTTEDCEQALREILGGAERVMSFSTPTGWRHDLLVNANTLARHMDLSRGPYLPFLPETLEDPFEIWAAFERHRGTGKIELRMRIIKAMRMGKRPGMMVVAQAQNGMLESWTAIPVSKTSYLENQRVGKLVWARDANLRPPQ